MSIFQQLAESFSLDNEVDRIEKLFSEKRTIEYESNSYTVKRVVTKYFFSSWESRGHCVDADDFLKTLDYDDLKYKARENADDFFTFAEIVLNFWMIVCRAKEADKDETLSTSADFECLMTIIFEDLSKLNHTFVYNDKNQQVLVVEDKPEVSALAAIVEPDFALEIVSYNHKSVQGDIEKKKSILRSMGNDLEPRRKILENINKNLSSDIFFMLNNMNIRHDNCSDKGSKNYKKYVAQMDKDQLEDWYNELYQMLILAFSEITQVDRHAKVNKLKDEIEISK